MPVSLPANKDFVTIGQAAKLLNVHIKTLRRWDQAGKISTVRLDGKNRYFSLSQLKKLKEEKPLSISQAAEKLNVSVSTLRRMDKRGDLKAERNELGERIYHPKIDKYASKPISVRPVTPFQKAFRPMPKNPIYADAYAWTKQKSFTSNPTPTGYQHPTINTIMKNAYASQGLFKAVPKRPQEESTPLYAPAPTTSANSIKSYPKISVVNFITSKTVITFLLFLLITPVAALGFIRNGQIQTNQFEQEMLRKSVLGSKLTQDVLAATTSSESGRFVVNIPTQINQSASVSGTLTAPNILYSVIAGNGISVGPGQNPTITNTGVLSVGGQTGAVTLTGGTGIDISGTTISMTSTGVTSLNTLNGALKIAGGGINSVGASGTTVTVTGTEADTLATVTGRGATTTTALTLSNTGNLISVGTLTFGTLTSNGGVLYTNGSGVTMQATAGSSGQCLLGGTTPSFGNCNSGSSDTFWDQTNGLLYPNNSTVDFAIGGQASTSAKFAVLNVAVGTPTASVSAGTAGGTYLTATGKLASTALQPMTIGDSTTTGEVVINPVGNVGIASTNPGAKLDITGTLRNSGAVTFSTFTTNGGLLYTNGSGLLTQLTSQGTTGQCLLSNGSGAATSFGNCNSGTADAFWNQTAGALHVNNSTVDLLVGGQASTSAKFAVLNVAVGTPTASVSAGTAGGTYLTATGNLATTAMQTLTLGGTTTGAIALSPASATPSMFITNGGNVGIGTTIPTTKLFVTDNSGSGSQSIAALSRTTSGHTVNFYTSIDATSSNPRVIFESSATTVSPDFYFQPSTGTTMLFLQSSTQFVGIGTTTPLAKLDVAGSASASGNLSFRGAATAHTFNYLDNGTLNFQRSPGGDAGLTSVMFLQNNGNVGIGTTTPGAKLDIAGTESTDDTIQVAPATGGAGRFSGTITSADLTASGNWSFPNAYGTICISGQTCASSGTVGYWSRTSTTLSPATANDIVSITSTNTSTALLTLAPTGVTGTGLAVSALSGTTSNTGINIGAISGTGATGTGITVGNISSTGTTNYGLQLGTMTGGTSSNYQIATGAITSATTTNNAQINLAGIVTTGGTNNYGINIGALSGTGTTNYGINITASTAIGTTNYGLNVGNITGAASGNNYGIYIGTVSGANTNTAANNFALYSSSTSYSYFGGNVGIGTTNPVAPLDIGADTNTVIDGLRFTNVNNSAAGARTIEWRNTNNVGYYATRIYADIGDFGIDPRLYFQLNARTSNSNVWTDVMTIRGGSNNSVGIGSTSPTATLDVVGSASLSANVSFRGAATAHTLNYLDNGTLNFQRSPSGDAGVTTVMFLQNNGNVGIGTTAPGNKLHVVGGYTAFNYAAAATQYMGTFQNNAATSDFSRVLILSGTASQSILELGDTDDSDIGALIYDQTANRMDFRTNNATQMSIASDGNVGIGTTTPAAILDVRNAGTTLTASISGSATVVPVSRIAVNYNNSASVTTGFGTLDLFNGNAVDNNHNSIDFTTKALNGTEYLAARIGTLYTRQTNSDTGDIFFATRQLSGGSIAERMRIKNDGNVGIGTTNPSNLLETNLGAYANYYDKANYTIRGIFQHNGNSGGLTITSQGTNQSSNGSGGISFVTSANGANATTDGATTTQMYIAYDGNVGIGTTTTTTYKLRLNGEPAANGYTAWTNYSDARLKTNIAYLDDGNDILSRIMQLKPAQFNYNSLTGYDQKALDRRITGFIAQDLMTVFPEMVGVVDVNGQNYYDTNLSALQVYLVRGIQAQQQEISQMQSIYSIDANGNVVIPGLVTNSLTVNGPLDVKTSAVSTPSSPDLSNLQTALNQLTAQNNTQDATAASLSARVAFLEQTVNTAVLGASTSAMISNQLLATSLQVDTATVSGDLNVVGRTTVADLGVTGNIIAGVMSIHGLDGEINTLAGDLKLQSNGLNGIDLVAGKVTIDTSGNITTEGTITAKKINVDTTEVLSASVGTGTLPSGDAQVTISTTAVTANSKIFVTATKKTGNQPLIVSQKNAGSGFVVSIENSYSSDIKFDWWIVN